MYHFTDFVTRRAIKESRKKKYVVFITAESFFAKYARTQEPKSYEVKNTSYIDELYAPISFPFVMTYDGHGEFSFHKDYEEVNNFSWGVLFESQLTKVEAKPDHLSDAHLPHDQFILATSYDLYETIFEKLRTMQARQGVFTREDTYEVEFYKEAEQVRSELASYDDEVKKNELAKSKERVHLMTDTTLPTAVNPVNNGSRRKPLSMVNLEFARRLLSEIDKNSAIPEWLISWNCFVAYLGMTRTIFAPVAGMGSQSTNKDMHKILIDFLK